MCIFLADDDNCDLCVLYERYSYERHSKTSELFRLYFVLIFVLLRIKTGTFVHNLLHFCPFPCHEYKLTWC